ncbi:hypothetical protein CgunFtcFv8_013363 [Champsocephalus gunnari]|uniref:MyBP-C tri-helix bundle domain-containing protein n=1 Tax=Champsocephalus gunnari TaxID=52237 RepID=A0AAN8DU05_CHAGU|nr:hypothetical protein CgunFtcFv8_013363 [Champsocephalus gunnari]
MLLPPKARRSPLFCILIVTENLALAFKKILKKCNVGKREEKWPPIEEEMLKILARNDKKDDERICTEHSFTDFRASSRS